MSGMGVLLLTGGGNVPPHSLRTHGAHNMSDTMTSQTFTPSAAFVTDLAVGSQAPDEFGRLRRVAEVFGRGVTPSGAPFVCVNLERGDCLVSASYAADRAHSTVHGRCEVAR